GDDGGFGIGAVKNSTDGYWYMPVLPEQLDVNIPIVSYASPEVSRMIANTKGLFVVFSKYMDESTLTYDRFTLFVNGVETSYNLSLVDSEKSGSAVYAPNYARTVKLTYDGMAEGDVVELMVDNRIESYAGVPMEERFESGRTTVSAPSKAATPSANVPAGKVDENTAVFITAPTGGTVVRYTVDGSDPTEESPVMVDSVIVSEDVTIRAIATGAFVNTSDVLTVRYTVSGALTAPDRPTASINGKAVNDGDTVSPGKLTLTCSTEGAEILYTLNGVCPCDDETARFVYSEPIDLKPGDYFFRIRALKDGVWSEGLPLHLTVKSAMVNPFDDVKSNDYFYDAVLWAVENGITNGTSATKFSPGAGCTRGQVVTFLWRASGEPEPTSSKNPFKDVKSNDYFYKAVLWAVEKGITNGTDKNHFSPIATCTRGQIVTFLWRSSGSPSAGSASNPFSDIKKTDYFYDAVLWAVSRGITNGTDKTHFSPSDTCTRGQVVTFLYRDRIG
ncbi:MAG: S-layer homology domain-containing protein, partial [Clostridia bacterium]|nr:S-layer homology domain-containing protein [Clostridia bacterium]